MQCYFTRLVARAALPLVMLFLAVACGAPAAVAPTAAPATTAPAPTTASTTAPLIVRGRGDPNAPVTIVEYSDFQCPFCARFVGETLPQLEKDYIATGKVYLQYRDFPLTSVHGSALLAAHAVNCAGLQGSYWPMHDRMFLGNSNNEWGSTVPQDFATFLGYARELKLDDKALQACIQSNTFAAPIQADYREALKVGVQSTPTFTVNGELLVGAQPFAAFKQAIDTALEKAK